MKMDKELVKFQEVKGVKFVASMRELYLDLGLDRTHWSRWSNKNIVKDCFFVENVDYEGFASKASGNKVNDYRVSLDMAKHLVMLARTEKSHKYRQYLIDYEKNNSQISYVESLRRLADQVEANERLKARGNLMMIQREDSSFKVLADIKRNVIPKYEEEIEDLYKVLERHDCPTMSEALKGTGVSAIKGNKACVELGLLYNEDIKGKTRKRITEEGEKYFKEFPAKKFVQIGIVPSKQEELVEMILENL